MKFRDFQLPNKIKWIVEEDNYGKFACEPFERGYGHTVGNSLRRILLASMEGAVITAIKIDGVQHEYTAMEGVKEDVLEIIFNLKQLRFKLYTEEQQRIQLNVSNKSNVKAADFVLNESVELYNPDAHIATLDKNGKLSMEATIEKGRGYSLASRRQELVTSIGEIPLDAAFSPVRKVNYDVENARVGQATDYDKLVMEIWTDGSIKPSETVAYAAQILKKSIDVFEISDLEEIELGEEAVREKDQEEILNMQIEEMHIGTRIMNSLRQADIKTVGELIEKTEGEILKLDKVGKKSIDEITEKLKKINEEKGTDFKLKG
ncbi:MAG: DNA-directed RNA polymerase subunit alpha [Elusimicrobiota bacterium]